MNFSEKLIDWYLPQKRELPWRNTVDPYKIWLSEIMLQQTRVAQGLPYYEVFLENFPAVFDLAKASEEKVLKLWQGLGYYSRARNMHFTAKYIAEEKNGEFPKTASGLLKLKGIGDYTAAAIASICFGEPVPVVDGNVYRALSRIFGIETPIDSTLGKKEFKQLAHQLIDPKKPAEHNQALMEFGALQCKPKNPLCETCPFQNSCMALQLGKIEKLPVKTKKIKTTLRHFNYLVFVSKNKQTLLQQRTGKGIWQNLYEFPLLESEKEETRESFVQKPELKKLVDAKKIELF
ncbi:MAG TPA: A/G-specific adenine glycosylase, partial [Flavobacteriaceae bacterium]|nr:A/G-specific adenine glycosylase [Flavobacteriaceae bacterium]